VVSVYVLSVYLRDIRESANNFEDPEGFTNMIDKMMKNLK
jgi:hypothetical protein